MSGENTTAPKLAGCQHRASTSAPSHSTALRSNRTIGLVAWDRPALSPSAEPLVANRVFRSEVSGSRNRVWMCAGFADAIVRHSRACARGSDGDQCGDASQTGCPGPVRSRRALHGGSRGVADRASRATPGIPGASTLKLAAIRISRSSRWSKQAVGEARMRRRWQWIETQSFERPPDRLFGPLNRLLHRRQWGAGADMQGAARNGPLLRPSG
jgi:hypothetical protein